MIKWNSSRYPFHEGRLLNYVIRFIRKRIFNRPNFRANNFQVDGSGNEIKVDTTNPMSLLAIGSCLQDAGIDIPIVLVTAIETSQISWVINF